MTSGVGPMNATAVAVGPGSAGRQIDGWVPRAALEQLPLAGVTWRVSRKIISLKLKKEDILLSKGTVGAAKKLFFFPEDNTFGLVICDILVCV
uniref:Uncharacterized protein n=3 Tax=Oryza TaxID=4527 RepID=A0A0D3HCK9_9ORYZ